MVLSMRCILARVHPRGIFHRGCIIPNTRQPRAPCHDGGRHGQNAGTIRTCGGEIETRILQRRGETGLAQAKGITAE